MTIANMILSLGQSNARAAGTVSIGFPGGWTSDANIKIWWYATQTWQTYNPGVNTDWTGSTGWGMEAEYARQWRIDHPTDTLYIWKQAVDGTPLYANGNPSAADWSPNSSTEKQFIVLIEQIKASQAALALSGLTPVVNTCLWMQGETDEQNGHATDYYANLNQFVYLLRQTVNNPNMHFVIGRILPYWNQSGGFVREGQAWMGSQSKSAWVNTDSFSTLTGSSGSHFNATGIVQLGSGMYAADATIV